MLVTAARPARRLQVAAAVTLFVRRVLAGFAPVRRHEAMTLALMFSCVFLIMCAYYILKTAREGLILSGGMFGLRGDELKIYAAGAMALLFLVIVPAYGALANRVGRLRLITISYAIVIACLLAFFVLARSGVAIALPFFVWLGLVSMFLPAQFWSYANDIYTEEAGKRLFAIIAVGGTTGAILGPKLTSFATTHTLLLFAASLIALVLGLFHIVERVQEPRARATVEPISGKGGFALVLRDRYLLAIAAMIVVANLVNSIGEFLLSQAAADRAAELAPGASLADQAARRELIKAFYGSFFFWVNLVGFAVQAFLVSRIMTRVGVRAALFVLPLIALGSYGAIAAIAGTTIVRIGKITENATDYSLQNTVRQALFLPTDRAVKYKAKAAIDTFFVRFGDTLSAIFVGVGIHQLGLSSRGLALVNVGLVAIWLFIVIAIAKQHRMIESRA